MKIMLIGKIRILLCVLITIIMKSNNNINRRYNNIMNIIMIVFVLFEIIQNFLSAIDITINEDNNNNIYIN
jgi:hypothetical protein